MDTSSNALSLANKTMSSTEIAKLTGKEHKNVIADIRIQIFTGLYEFSKEKMAEKSAINEIQGVTVVLDRRGYWKEVLLDREHTLTLVTGYDVKARHAINKRWLKLEAAHSNKIPSPLSTYPTPEQRESIVNAIRQLSGITTELTNVLEGEYIAKNERLEPTDYFAPADDLELDSIIDAICSDFKLASSFKIAINLRLLQATGVSPDNKTKRHIPTITNQLHQIIEITKTIRKHNVTSELDGLRRLVLKV